MDKHIMSIVGVGIALASVTWATTGRLEAGIVRVEERLTDRIDNVEVQLGARIDMVEEQLRARIDKVEEQLGARISKVEEQLGARIGTVEEQIRTLDRRLTVVETSLKANNRLFATILDKKKIQTVTDAVVE